VQGKGTLEMKQTARVGENNNAARPHFFMQESAHALLADEE
jgi:hypothetical protein